MKAPLLRLDAVSKAYPLTTRASSRFRAFWEILFRGNAQGGTQVLDDISLEVMPGESLAILGANGAGKSTLLKIITGVLAASSGQISQRGSIAALLELGAGFDPEYSGRENLYMNAAMHGLTRKQVNDKLADILDFADIGPAIDEPVKHYSSGMVVRLGFAIVASVRPDLLITDEVLAVGDESFQKKCIRWIENYLEQGGTLLMASHNIYQVQKLCRHALWLDGGKTRAMGDVFDVTQAYLAWHDQKSLREKEEESYRPSSAVYAVDSLEIMPSASGNLRFAMGEHMSVNLRLSSPDGRTPVVLVGIVRNNGSPVYGVASDFDDFRLVPDGEGFFRGRLEFEDLALLPGSYTLRAHAMNPEGLMHYDTVEAEFTVCGRSREYGVVRLPHHWKPG